MFSTRRFGILSAIFSALLLAGCTAGADPLISSAPREVSGEATAPNTTRANEVPEICTELPSHLEALNFFPPTLSDTGDPNSSPTENSAVKNVRALEAEAPSEIQGQLTALREIMAQGVADPAAFDFNGFVDAKIEVETWAVENCRQSRSGARRTVAVPPKPNG